MENLWRKMRQKRQGFTLIELIVVIAVLAILATIVVPRLGAFRDQALDTRETANARIAEGAAAMWIAQNGNPSDEVTWDASTGQSDWGTYMNEWPQGVSWVKIATNGNISSDKSGETGTGGDGGGAAFTASWVKSTVGNTNSATVSATSGNLLVAMVHHRQLEGAAFPGTASATGWTNRGTSSFKTSSHTNDRRAVAVFTRIATGTSADNFTASWTGSPELQGVIIQEFSVSSAPISFTFNATPSGASTITSLALSANGPSSGNALLVAGVAARDGNGSVSWSGVSNARSQAPGSMTGSMASAQITGPGPHSATATLNTTLYASGFTLVIR